jgi:hypothetical protein
VEPGLLAYIALLLAFPASIAAFAVLSTTRAALFIIFWSMLFLPERVSMRIPGMELDKKTIALLCVLLGIALTARHRIKMARLGKPIDWLMLAVLLAPLGTVYTNGDQLQIGATWMPGLTYKDYFHDAIQIFFDTVAPFFIGRVLFRTVEDAKDLLRAYVLFGLIYVPFILVELRMSPQFHNWVYGYGPSAFAQAARGDDSWRPVVFMGHGLGVAMFIWSTVMAAWLLQKMRAPFWGSLSRVPAWVLTVVLPALNSLGALVYGLVTVPLVWFTRTRVQLGFAAFLAVIVLTYPHLRANDLIPDQYMVDLSARYASQSRADSLSFRFDNEKGLLQKALERPVFGWGGWGRSRVFDETGLDLSVTDGEWVIRLGVQGYVGYYTVFGLMLVPIFFAMRRVAKGDPETQVLIGGFALLTGVRAVDLLPNSGGSIGLLFAGTLAGLSYGAGETQRIDSRVLLAKLLALRQLRILRSAGGGR